MKTLLILTEARSLELARCLVKELNTYSSFIGRIMVLSPTASFSEHAVTIQPTDRFISGRSELGKDVEHVWSIFKVSYRHGLEPLLLPHMLGSDGYDLVIACDSALAEATLLGRQPDASHRTTVLRHVPWSRSGFELREQLVFNSSPIRSAIYLKDNSRVDLVLVPDAESKRSLSNNAGTAITVPVETALFPILAGTPYDKATVRNNILLPDGKTSLTKDDVVVITLLPSLEEIGISQPDILTLLEVAEETISRINFRWIVLAQSATYQEVFRSQALSQKLRQNLILAGKKDAPNFYFEAPALYQFLSAADIVLDTSRDHVGLLLLETAKRWGLPVIHAQYGNQQVETDGTDLFGKRPERNSTVDALVKAIKGQGNKVTFRASYPTVGELISKLGD